MLLKSVPDNHHSLTKSSCDDYNRFLKPHAYDAQHEVRAELKTLLDAMISLPKPSMAVQVVCWYS